MTITESPKIGDPARKKIAVTVNRRRVKITGARQTGRSVKEAAAAQGVPIQLDFLLSRKEGKKFKPVADDQQFTVREDDEFRAVDGDDNS